MTFEDIIVRTAEELDRRGRPNLKEKLGQYVMAEAMPESVILRRSTGVDDDLAAATVLADQLELEDLRKRVSVGLQRLSRHPKHLVEAWAMCETLRRLGFPIESMAVHYGDVEGYGDGMIYIRLQRRDKAATMSVCVAKEPGFETREQALAGWDDMWKDIIDAGEDDLSVLLARSTAGDYRRLVALVAELARQGFGIPVAEGARGPLTLLANPSLEITDIVGKA